jgi:hypothetical protein
MKLTTVLASVNNNPAYYMFIPKQIVFWHHFYIKFIAIFVGPEIPAELMPYTDNIILWTKNSDINSAFLGQNIRIYYPALLSLPEDEAVMITDMDMLPTNDQYYTAGLESFTKDDFIYYRHVDGNQIYMCYNAAHPTTWSKIFNITSDEDIEAALSASYNKSYDGRPGLSGWFSDQELMYTRLISYPHLKVLNRPIKRLEIHMFNRHLAHNNSNFIKNYDDFHAHRNYFTNIPLIIHAEQQLKHT